VFVFIVGMSFHFEHNGKIVELFFIMCASKEVAFEIEIICVLIDIYTSELSEDVFKEN
jgi:NADH:ubiquinone oxidoreductase subunit K